MAFRADVNFENIAPFCSCGNEFLSASADALNVVVIGMNLLFHCELSFINDSFDIIQPARTVVKRFARLFLVDEAFYILDRRLYARSGLQHFVYLVARVHDRRMVSAA